MCCKDSLHLVSFSRDDKHGIKKIGIQPEWDPADESAQRFQSRTELIKHERPGNKFPRIPDFQKFEPGLLQQATQGSTREIKLMLRR